MKLAWQLKETNLRRTRSDKNYFFAIIDINCSVLQGFPALRKAITAH